jgi:ribonuclease VapC
MFVDASALVAAFSAEAEEGRIEAVLNSATAAFTSPLAVLEAALALARAEKWNAPVDEVTASVLTLLEDSGVAVREADDPVAIALLAGEAARRFRAGRRRLNLADCMHYAFARHYDVPILATADEFRQTDLTVVP